MAANNVLRWQDGRGWLVFAGTVGDDDIRAAALGRVSADGALAYVCLGMPDQCEHDLADLEELGAAAGYLVDVMTEDDDTIRQKLSDAGMIVIAGGGDAAQVRSALLGAAAEGILKAFANGALILVEGAAVQSGGAWVIAGADNLLLGLAWVENALLLPGITSISESAAARSTLLKQPAAIAIGIGPDSALVLGPDGEIETWGGRRISIALGSGYEA